jgi:hypothetical protein
MIWNKCPEGIFVGGDVLEFGVYDAVAHFNMGSRPATCIMQELDLEPGCFFEEGKNNADEVQIGKAEHREKAEVKKQRKVLRGQKKKKEDKSEQKEGKIYEAGGF